MNTQIQKAEDFTSIEAEAFAEHEAAKAKAKADADAKEEAERKARWAKEEKERQEKNVLRSIHLKRIAACIGKDHTWSIDEKAFKLIIDGVDCSYCYDFEQQWSRGGRFGWGSKPTGKMKFVVSTGGFAHRERQTYREKANGMFNYQAIADHLVSHADRRNANTRLERQRDKNKSAAAKLAKELFKAGSYQSVINPSMDAKKPVFFKFKIEQAMTENDARKLAKAIRSCGIKLYYDDDL